MKHITHDIYVEIRITRYLSRKESTVLIELEEKISYYLKFKSTKSG